MIILWTIYVSLAFYVFALFLLITARNAQARRLARLAWTTAFLCYLAHVVAAYHFQHHWSQTDALHHAAKRIDEVVGLNWSGGLYVNYVFTLIWLVDVAWWWIDAGGYQARATWITATIQGFFTFIAFNSTVVFATGAVRWIGLTATIGLAALWWMNRRRDKYDALADTL